MNRSFPARLAEVKIREAQYDLQTKEVSLENKARTYLNEMETTENQIILWDRTVNDYEGLLNGERNMFDQGESSLFMVNRREVGYINARIKLINLITKNRKSKIKTLYMYGILNEAL